MKIILKYLALILIFYLSYVNCCAKQKFPRYEFGIAASSISGGGVNYQLILSDRFRFGVNIFYYYEKTDENNYDKYAIAGTEH